MATIFCHVNIMKSLLTFNAQVDLRDNVSIPRMAIIAEFISFILCVYVFQSGCTALMFASGKGRIDMVELLLKSTCKTM